MSAVDIGDLIALGAAVVAWGTTYMVIRSNRKRMAVLLARLFAVIEELEALKKRTKPFRGPYVADADAPGPERP